MEIKAFSKIKLTNVTFQHKIKLMSYDESKIIIVTKYNEIYCLKQKDDPSDNIVEEYYFEKIDFFSPFEITHLICYNDSIILINKNNELFLKGCFSRYGNENDFGIIDSMESLKYFKIKYLRLGSNFLFILTNDNTLYGFGDDCDGRK